MICNVAVGWDRCCCLAAKSHPTVCGLKDDNLPGSSVHVNFPGKNTGVGCHFLHQGSSRTRVRTHVSSLAGGFFTTGPPGKPGWGPGTEQLMKPRVLRPVDIWTRSFSRSGVCKLGPVSRCSSLPVFMWFLSLK